MYRVLQFLIETAEADLHSGCCKLFHKNFFTILTVYIFLLTVLVIYTPVVKLSHAETLEEVLPFSAILPKGALEMIRANKANPDFTLIDIRTPEEYLSGHIEGAVNINYHDEEFVDNLDKLDKNKTYLIYCRTGRRTADTFNVMKKLKFKKVYRIQGEIVRWKAEGLPLINGR